MAVGGPRGKGKAVWAVLQRVDGIRVPCVGPHMSAACAGAEARSLEAEETRHEPVRSIVGASSDDVLGTA